MVGSNGSDFRVPSGSVRIPLLTLGAPDIARNLCRACRRNRAGDKGTTYDWAHKPYC